MSSEFFEENKHSLKCNKCGCYLYGPKTCSDCGSTFCTPCIQARKNSCPDKDCNGKTFDLELKKLLRDKLSKVALFCENGCESKVVTMLNYKEHLEQCSSEPEREIIIDTSKELNFDIKSVSEYSVTTAKTDKMEDEVKIYSKEDENLISIIKQNIKDNKLNLNHYKGDINKLLSVFISCEFLKNITSINLASNKIGAEGMNHLSKCTFLSNLTKINLSYNYFGELGMN